MTWKNTERAVAARLGGQRVPITGRARGDVPDIAHTWLSVEVKHRRALPRWLKLAVEQAEAAVRGDQLPIVVLHEEEGKHNDDLVVMRLEDFVDWFGSIVGNRRDDSATAMKGV